MLVFAGNPVYGQTNDNAIDKQIDRLFSNYNQATPGVAVAVVQNGKIIFKKGYGAANLECDIPITTKTVFQIASVSKQFTAFSIYLLEKQGKISLEDDVRKYVPEVPDFGKTVRLKHLLAHTSGIKDQAALQSLAGWRGGDVTTTQDVLRLISRQKELNFEPGSRYLYSNSGYTLLAEIVKRVSGESFAGFTRKNIFVPLGMTDTQFYDDFERIVKNRADSYELTNGTYKKKVLSNSADGASNLYTTVEDMAKWVLNFENPKVGDAELIKRFNEASLLNNGERVVWGIADGEPGYHAKGQIHWNYRGLHLMSHGGHAAAFRSFLGRFPEKRLAVIALSNDEHYLNFDTSIKIAEFYLKDDLKPNPVINNPAAQNKTAQKPNANLKDFEGRFYSEELDAAYDARVLNGKLFLSHIRHGDIELTEAGKDKFSGRIGFPVEIEFIRDENAAVNGFRISNFGAKNVKFDKAGK
ncbi:MAG TPA: serine hydrolase domain-containing protein [Pyrinomonadaceae bacterium]